MSQSAVADFDPDFNIADFNPEKCYSRMELGWPIVGNSDDLLFLYSYLSGHIVALITFPSDPAIECQVTVIQVPPEMEGLNRKRMAALTKKVEPDVLRRFGEYIKPVSRLSNANIPYAQTK